jgi:IS1 family transposase
VIEEYLITATRIRQEVTDLERVVRRAERAMAAARHRPEDQDLYMDSAALNIHDFYGGMERIFQQIATTIDDRLPAGQEWHRQLLQQMQTDLPEVRPPVLSAETGLALDEFLRFRHVVRHIYAFQFDPERVARLVRSMKGARWLWLVIDPTTKLIPALHLGGRKKEDAYALVHQLKLSLEPGWTPLVLTDGLGACFSAITAHFGQWVQPATAPTQQWPVDEQLLYGQLVKRTHRRKLVYTITRMLWGRREELTRNLRAAGLSGLIQTAFIERVNLTIRQAVAPLRRKTWSLAQTEATLLAHVEWWRLYYHFGRDHAALRTPVAGFKGRYHPRTPAMAAGLTDRLWTVGELLRTPIILPKS